MPISSVETANASCQTTQNKGENIRFIAESTGLTGLLSAGICAGFARFQKISEDEFVEKAPGLEKFKDHFATQMDEDLRKLFKAGGEKIQEACKIIKDAKIKRQSVFGLVIGLLGGLFMGYSQIQAEKKACELENYMK